jgi:hypothetical protein
MRLLREVGHEFHAYSFDVPVGAALETLVRDGSALDSLEIILPWSRMREALRATGALRAATGLKIHLSKLRKHEDARFDGSRFSHFINHGFVLPEASQIAELLEADPTHESFDGLVFRVPRHEAPARAIESLRRYCREIDRRAVAHVRIAAEDPAEAKNEDLANACRIAETVFAGLAHPDVAVYLDTFMDVDRGYFPRTGFIDRRYNPRLASRVYAALHATLAGDALSLVGEQRSESATILYGRAGESDLALVLPAHPQVLPPLDGWTTFSGEMDRSIEVVNLSEGVHRTASDVVDKGPKGERPARLSIEVNAPTLLRIPRFREAERRGPLGT